MKTPIRDRPNIRDSNPRDRARADSKPEPSQGYGLPFLGITKSDELGALGGVGIRGDVSVYVPVEVPVQVIFNPVTESVKVAAGFDIGIAKIKLGVTAQNTDQGGAIQNSSFGVGFLGFGVSAEGAGAESSKLGVSAFGFDVSIANDKEGRTSVRLGFDIPGISGGVTFTPDGTKPDASPGTGNDDNYGIGFPIEDITPSIDDNKCYHVVILWHCPPREEFQWEPSPNIFIRASAEGDIHGAGVWTNDANRYYCTVDKPLPYPARSAAFIEKHDMPSVAYSEEYYHPEEFGKYKANFKAWGLLNGYSLQMIIPNGYQYAQQVIMPFHITGSGKYVKDYVKNWKPTGEIWDISVCEIPCSIYPPFSPDLPKMVTPAPKPGGKTTPQNLPNYPQNYDPMDCCDKVDEIYKYLGIAKLKKNKFPISKAFLVPGGSGTDDCIDYYAISQALFRMLANGLIINPKSKPLGTEWQNANATAWASAMYEMTAESMSNGDSTQRFEISAIMQLVQMMSAIAETGRKVEFVADAIGIEPMPVPEELPVPFTIYEKHKGFGKKGEKKINISAAKTDDQIEKVLGKMLAPSLIPIVTWKFKPGQISIAEALRNG